MNYWMLKKKDNLYPIEVVYICKDEQYVCVHVECTQNRKTINKKFDYLKINSFPIEPKQGDMFIMGVYNYDIIKHNYDYRIFKGE